MYKLIVRLLTVVLVLLLVSRYVPGIEVEGFYAALIAAVVLGLLNLVVRPILVILTLPITLLTLGLFVLVINGLLFWFASSFLDGFTVTGFVPALVGAAIVSAASALVQKVL